MNYFILYLWIINAVGFAIMHADKKKARQKAWRISEATLLGVGIIGGSLGCMLGMYAFRHKTKHPKFYIGLPLILLGQLLLLAAIWQHL